MDPDEEPGRLAADGATALFVGRWQRFATCTGVAWLDDATLVTAYLLTGSLATYRSPDDGTVGALPPTTRVWRERGILGGATPTMLTADRERGLVAMPMSASAASPAQVVVAPVDVATGEIRLATAVIIPSVGDTNLHAVEFSPDGRFLVWSTIDGGTRGLRVVSLHHRTSDGPSITVGDRVDHLLDDGGVAPKGVAFSPDGRRVALAFGANASFRRRRAPRGRVETREWRDGRLGPVISVVDVDLVCPEDVAFHPAGDRVAVTDQIDQRVRILSVAPHSGRLHPRPIHTISWASGGLRTPHACAFSPSGQWLAVTNYGDSSLRYFDRWS